MDRTFYGIQDNSLSGTSAQPRSVASCALFLCIELQMYVICGSSGAAGGPQVSGFISFTCYFSEMSDLGTTPLEILDPHLYIIGLALKQMEISPWIE